MDATAPNEEQFEVQEQVEQGTDEDQFFDTPEDALDALEDDEAAAEETPAEADEESADPDDSVTVDLDGVKVTLKELKAGYYRQKDYTHKTTEVAQERKEVAQDRKAVEESKVQLAERSTVIETALQSLSGYLQNLIPPEPPLQLAQTDPGKYQYQRALRENAIAELGQLVSIKAPVDQHKQAVSASELREYRERESAALIKAMPALADPVKRVAFDQSVKNAATAFGFNAEEIEATADHRVLRLVHYAKIGMKAEENRKNAAKRVETPKEVRISKTVSAVNAENQKAMRALSKTGSIKDAMKIDFD